MPLPWMRAIAIFLVTRWWYWDQGVRFWSDSVYQFFQLLDPTLLQDRLAESLFWLHAQPPLFNLLTGIALKLAPGHFPWLLWGLFLAVGLATMLAVVAVVVRLGGGPRLALLVGTLYCCTPPFLVFENLWFYPHLCAALLVGTAWALLRSRGVPGRWTAAALWMVLALVLLRSLFHPLFLGGVIALVVAFAPRGRRMAALRLAAIPVAIVGLLLARNVSVFGLAGTSSWGGNSLHRVAAANVGRLDLEALVEAGVLSPVSLEDEFSAPEVFLRAMHLPDRDRGAPAIDALAKRPVHPASSIQPANRNHWAYLEASRAYQQGALALIARHPQAFLATVEWNVRRFLAPVTWDNFVVENRNRTMVLSTWVERLEQRSGAGWLGVPVLAWALVAALRRRTPRDERLFLAFLLAAMAWVATVGVLAETGENNRFRFEIMGLAALAAAYAVRDLGRLLAPLGVRVAAVLNRKVF